MPIAQPRYLFSDICGHDSASCFMSIPVGEGESIRSISGMIQASSLPGNQNDYGYLGPFAFLEHNIVGIFVPFDVAMTLTPPQQTESAADRSKTVSALGGQDASPRYPRLKRDWDRMFRSLVFEMGIDGDQFYGAEVDGSISAHTYDPIENVWLRRPGDPAAGTGSVLPPSGGESDDLALQGRQDEPFMHISELPTYGPRGVRRIFSDERMLFTDSVTNAAKGSSSVISNLFGQLGINDMAFRDTVKVFEPELQLPGPGFILVGAIRFQVDVPTYEFSVSTLAPKDEADDSVSYQTRSEIINALMTGDHQRIEAAMQFSTTGRGDLARTLVFGGDNCILSTDQLGKVGTDEYDTVNGKSVIRSNPIVYAGKLHVIKGTPYHLSPV